MRYWSLIFFVASMASAADYRAGLARVDITPPIGHQMGGYAARKHGSTGLHDPLYATVLVVETDDNSVALVTCDLRSFVSTRVGELAKRRFGIKNTLIDVSHTHSGPLTWELHSPWYAEAEDKMVEAIGRAKAAEFPASLQISSGHIYLGFNRRKIVDGKGFMWWRNAEELPSHPLDPTVNILEIKDDTGKIRGVLVNYACHASVLGPQNYDYSADYPGAMKRYVESKIPGAMALFVQGGAGDINPYHDKEPVATQFQAVEDMGQALGKYVVSILDSKPKIVTGPLLTTSEVINVKNRWKPNENIPIGWMAGEFGNSFCFAGFPGEPFVELQVTFRQKSECENAMLFGYSYSVGGAWAGYIPTILASVQGGYGADYNTTVEVGTGERLVDRAVIKLFQLRGLLHDVPDPRF